MIIFLRGKAATGKTMIANALHNELKMPIVRKDDIFDMLLDNKLDIQMANSISYDMMAMYIQQLDQCGIDAIVDIGLSHTPSFVQFLNKMAITNPKYFLCTCSNDQTWSLRIQRRIDEPDGPNQMFTSTDHAFEHYDRYDITPIKSEKIIDSILPINTLVDNINDIIKRQERHLRCFHSK